MQMGFDVADSEIAIESARACPLDHRGAQIDAVYRGRNAAKGFAAEARAATQIERDKCGRARQHQPSKFAQDLRRTIGKLAAHARVVVGRKLVEEMAD